MTILEDLQKQKSNLVEDRSKLLLKESEVKRLLDLNKKQTKLIVEAIEKEEQATNGHTQETK